MNHWLRRRMFHSKPGTGHMTYSSIQWNLVMIAVYHMARSQRKGYHEAEDEQCLEVDIMLSGGKYDL